MTNEQFSRAVHDYADTVYLLLSTILSIAPAILTKYGYTVKVVFAHTFDFIIPPAFKFVKKILNYQYISSQILLPKNFKFFHKILQNVEF